MVRWNGGRSVLRGDGAVLPRDAARTHALERRPGGRRPHRRAAHSARAPARRAGALRAPAGRGRRGLLPTATRMLDARSERDGTIVRRPSQTDRRCVLVALTDAGREALKTGRTAARARRRALRPARAVRARRCRADPGAGSWSSRLDAVGAPRPRAGAATTPASRSCARRTLPLAVFGRSSAKSTTRGYLYGAVWP